jgi:hypothetical protein
VINRNRFVWAAILAPIGLYGAELPAGHLLEVRLLAKVASDESRPGDRISAELISPVVVNGQVVVPAGAIVLGRVKKASALGFGLRRGRAALGLDFDELSLPSEQIVEIRTTMAKVDTARENLNEAGHVDGISPAMSASSALGAYAWRLVILEPGIGAAVWAIKFALAPAPDPEVRLPVGTEILIRLTHPVEVPDWEDKRLLATLDPAETAELRERLESVPLRVRRKSGELADRINVVIAGEADALLRTFAAAGWSFGEKQTPMSLAKTYYHIVQRKGYPTGPMSPMTFDGNTPDFTFQKTLNTYARRHHLRIWRAGTLSSGTPIWAAAATEDTTVNFSQKKKFWTHEIDLNIDNERAKVVSDLLYTGCVEATSLVDVIPLDTPEFITDGAVAGIRLNSCDEPRAMVVASASKPSGNAFYRGLKAICKDAVRSNFGNIAVTGAHAPPQALASRPASANHREVWAQQQSSLLNRRAAVE